MAGAAGVAYVIAQLLPQFWQIAILTVSVLVLLLPSDLCHTMFDSPSVDTAVMLRKALLT